MWTLLGGSIAVASFAACSGGSGSNGGQSGSVDDGGSTFNQPGDYDPDGGSATPTEDGGGSGAKGGQDGAAAEAGSSAPTVSSWLGTNVNVDLPRVDVTYQLNPFTVAADDGGASQLDENGYPVAGVKGTSSTDIGFVLPTGTYKISYVGTGALSVSGIGKLGGAWTTAGGEQRNTVTITGTPGNFGNFLTLSITNAPGQTVTSVHLLMPGFDYDTTTIFTPQFLSILGPFRAMRFMEWMNTNNSTLANWSDRPAASHFGQSSYGQPYEHIAALVNQTGKDAWINIPEHATMDFVTQFADFMAQNLDFDAIAKARAAAGFSTPFQLILENSNETWNGGFSAYNTFLAAANLNTTRYTGTFTGTFGPTWMSGNSNLMKVAQYEADTLVEYAQVFRTELGKVGHGDCVAPVLSGWALGAAYSDEGLEFIKANYGKTASTYVSYIASAPYFGLTTDSDSAALATLFTDMDANIAAMDTTFQDFAKLVTQDGVKMSAYEGGQGLSGTTNQSMKHLAQHDERMYEAYKQYFALWKKDMGDALFMHFDLTGDPGLPENIYQYGFWGSIIGVMEDTATCKPNLPTLTGTEAIASVVHHCPKYRALAEAVPE
jgi:hypothetical protein